ncbi:hypothetical protein FRC09_010461, partial [Ceratobasidium sp. 395]
MAFRRWAYSLASTPAGSAEAASMLGRIEEGGLACKTVLGAGVGGRVTKANARVATGTHKRRRPKRGSKPSPGSSTLQSPPGSSFYDVPPAES